MALKRGDLQSNGLPPDGKRSGGDSEPRPSNDFDAAAELELIDAALSDDKQAFSDLFERYRPDLYALCFQRLNDHSLAEDVVQEAFIRVLTHLPTFDRSKRFWPWLATIAVRMCTDLQRRRSFTHYSGDIGVSLDNGVHKGRLRAPAGPAPDAVIASEDREEFWKSLEVLPKRQRRAFVLYTLDGLSCADIAAAEGVSVGAVHRLLYRARKKLRATHPNRPLPAIVLPFTWMRWKLQQIEERVRPYLGVYSEGFSTACAQAVCLGTVAAMLVATGNSVELFDGNDAGRSVETASAAILSATQSRPLETVLPNAAAPAKVPTDSRQPFAWVSEPLVDTINPNESATPETTHFTALTASPNYQSDHTLLALGFHAPANLVKGFSVLFASRDGGASWKPLPSSLLVGHTMALPPTYPRDRRMFSLGGAGLQQSDDEGAVFKTVSPSFFTRDIAISPLFGRGDSRILMADKTLLEYDADTGITRPASLIISPSLSSDEYQSIVFSPNYKFDSTIFFAGNGLDRTILYRCEGVVCDKTRFPFFGSLTLRPSPRFAQDNFAYAFTLWKLLISNDGARTFQDLQFPLPDSGSIHDVAAPWNEFSNSGIFISVVYGPTPSIYHSLDAGHSWSSTSIDLPGFHDGAEKLIVTPTGRLLAVGTSYGLACSVDQGQTWARRCPPEQ